MPNRPQQHQLEDFSMDKFRLLKPKGWAFRDKRQPDYGIDGEVEIFDKHGNTTGLIFYVQLKATEDTSEAEARKIYGMKVDTISYYLSLPIHVMIAKYSEKTDTWYFKWAHEIDLYYVKNRKINISFSDKDILTVDKLNKIPDYLEKMKHISRGVSLPTAVFLTEDAVNTLGIPFGIFMPECRIQLKKYNEFVRYVDKPDDAILKVYINDHGDLTVSLMSIEGFVLHDITIKNTDEIKIFVAYILLELLIVLAKTNNYESVARIFLDEKFKEDLPKSQQINFLIFFMFGLISTSRFGEIIDRICELMDDPDDDTLEFTAIAASLSDQYTEEKAEKSQKFEKLLNKCLEKNKALGYVSGIGFSHYNLGNFHMNRRNYKKAISHYFKAKKYRQEYLKEAYFYEDIASLLFSMGKYRFAARVYKMAIDKGAAGDILARYADALMFSGYYQMAYDNFSDYLGSVSIEREGNSEWILKKDSLIKLIEMTGIKEHYRQQKAAIQKAVSVNDGDAEYMSTLLFAIELDPLCEFAWFNYGVATSKGGQHEIATFSFLMCAIAQNDDIDAWVNAIFSFFNVKEYDPQHFLTILETAYDMNGDAFLSELNKKLSSNFKGQPQHLSPFIDYIEKFVSSHKKEAIPPTIRIYDDSGDN